MPVQAVRSEVKFKARRNALLLGEFTIAQLVRATGLNPESVRTEVQRLKQEGFVVSERRPGRREALYRLSDDPEKRLALSRSVEAFYPEPPEPIPPRPTSRLYQAALQSLDQAEREKGRRREELLEQAAHQLEGAWQAEGASRAPEPVQAHVLQERGRLAYLQGQREPARGLLTQARETFAAAGLEGETRLVDEYLQCIEAWRRIEVSRAPDAAAKIRCVLEALEAAEHPPTSPLVRLLADLARHLSLTIRDRVAQVTLMAEIHREVVGVREDLQRLEPERIPEPMALGERPGISADLLAEIIQPRPEPGLETYFDRPRRQSRRRETND
jgi:DNA-binding transcriptional ArsR family regulator